MFNQLKTIYQTLTKLRKQQLFILFSLLLFVVLLENIGLVLIFSYIKLLVHNGPQISILTVNLIKNINLNYFTLYVIIFFILSSLIRIFQIKYQMNYLYNVSSDLGNFLFDINLRASYIDLLSINKNRITSILAAKINDVVINIVQQIFNITQGVFMFSVFLLTLIYLNMSFVFIFLFIIALFYFIISSLLKKKIKQNSFNIAKNQTNYLQFLNDVYRNYKYIIFKRNFSFYTKQNLTYLNSINKPSAYNMIYTLFPKVIVESIVIIMVLILLLLFSNDSNNLFYPKAGTLIFSILRLLPYSQSIYAGITNIRSSLGNLNDICDSLENTKVINKNNSDLILNVNSVEFKNLSYIFNDGTKLFSSLNLKINPGDILGIIGPSGSGKTTLCDIILNLRQPSEGHIFFKSINNEIITANIEKKIAYVPQNHFITHGTIIDNIVYGEDTNNINFDKIYQILNLLDLHDLFMNYPYKLYTNISEASARLSGGQMQRLCIARGLYNEFDVLILDEPTSAIEESLEKLIIERIVSYYCNKIIIIISHSSDVHDLCNKHLYL
jgi:ABC-type multidrug transport system fused ATPase/permease subunit